MTDSINILQNTLSLYPSLERCKTDIEDAFQALVECYKKKGKVLICGNGGSAADSSHIVTELMKSFLKPRVLNDNMKNRLIEIDKEKGRFISKKLQRALPAISLPAQAPLCTAVANDTDACLIYAQQVIGYGNKNDVLIGISTSGHAENVVNALIVAKSLDIKTIGLTGKTGGKMKKYCDILICAPEKDTFKVQEFHLPIYHTLCAMVEAHFFK